MQANHDFAGHATIRKEGDTTSINSRIVIIRSRDNRPGVRKLYSNIIAGIDVGLPTTCSLRIGKALVSDESTC